MLDVSLNCVKLESSEKVERNRKTVELTFTGKQSFLIVLSSSTCEDDPRGSALYGLCATTVLQDVCCLQPTKT